MIASKTIEKENMNIMQVPTSPSFLKPKPIKLKKRALKPTALPLDEVDANKKNVGYLTKSQKLAYNPFRQRTKKRKIEEGCLDDESNSLLWMRVNKVQKSKVLSSPVVPSMLDESALSPFSESIASTFQLLSQEVKVPQKKKILSVDWSLKTKIRFTSPHPFPSRGCFRTFEEVNGTIGFVRCLHSGDDMDNKSSGLHSSLGAKFFQQCLVWMHPNIPWLNLYPRSVISITKNKSSSIMLDSAAEEKLHSSWCDSFRSLYQLVRLYQCPYFYMCASSFTVLFRCAGAGSIPVLHAFITPTSKGFRKALSEDGITFSMPFCPNKECSKDSESGFEEINSDSMTTSNFLDLEEEGPNVDNIEDHYNIEDEDIEDDETDTWLESLGLSQENFPSFNKNKRRDERDKLDHKPESLVYVEDSETQALVNFFLNSGLCISKIGPMAGIPPTLLAPIAFLGGTLQSLKIRHGKVKNGTKEMESLEVTGPILPNTLHSLCSLFSGSQEEFSAIISSDTYTTAFSKVNPQSPILPCIFAKNNLTDCGLPETFLNQMCSKTEVAAITSVTWKDGLFSWN